MILIIARYQLNYFIKTYYACLKIVLTKHLRNMYKNVTLPNRFLAWFDHFPVYGALYKNSLKSTRNVVNIFLICMLDNLVKYEKLLLCRL